MLYLTERFLFHGNVSWKYLCFHGNICVSCKCFMNIFVFHGNICFFMEMSHGNLCVCSAKNALQNRKIMLKYFRCE